MANAWKQVDQISSEAIMHMEDRLVISSMTARDKTSEFNKTPDGYAVGSTIRIKTRPDYDAKEFAGTVQVQEIRESTRTMTIEKHFDVSVELTAKEKALDFESFAEQVIMPASYRLAEKIELYAGSKLLKAHGMFASNDLFADAADMALARKAANFQQLSPTGRFCIVNDTLEAKLLGKDYFNKAQNRGDDGVVAFREAILGRAMGLQFYSSMQFPTWTLASAGAGTTQTNNGVAVNGIFPNNKIGDTALVVDALTNTFPAGTRIQIAGVRRPLVVATLASAGATSVALVDPITEVIPDNAAITVVGSGQSNLTAYGVIMDDQSLGIAMPALDLPSDKLAYNISNNGFGLRVVVGYDMTTKKDMMSIDCLVGVEAWDPRKITLLTEY